MRWSWGCFSLSPGNVIDRLHSLAMGRKSCKLVPGTDGENGKVFIVEDQVTPASYGPLVEEAAFRVPRSTGGNFQIPFRGQTDQETTPVEYTPIVGL